MPRYDVACQRILRSIGEKEVIRSIIRRANLSKIEERVMEMRYVERIEDMHVIADRMGYSYSTVAKCHTSATRKIMQFIV